MINEACSLGTIISGSLVDGLIMRLRPGITPESFKVGKFVTVHGASMRFFSLITDLKLEVSHPDILLFPPTPHEHLLHQALQVKDISAVATLRPLIALDEHGKKVPVKTIPGHFAQVTEAHEADIAHIFGDPRIARYFSIGTPIDMKADVCIDLDRLSERSTGIFGKTGTGKTFVTRLLLAGIMHREKAVTLIFDMHSEYGLQARQESGAFVKGLKTLFGNSVALFSLDPQSTRRRGGSPDGELRISYESIAVEDLLSLQNELNLHPTAYEAAYLLAARYKKQWLAVLFKRQEEIKELAVEIGAHPESLAALYRKVRNIQRFSFISPTPCDDVVNKMVDYIDRGISIIIEFGTYTSTLCYLLIANVITRRIHALYIAKTEKFLGTNRASDEPKKLMIVIEEAHKFLNVAAARQTIFGIIAREMRKYYVTLLIVDQRPSGIDPEILSQIGTKIVAQLNDDKDIQAVLTGMSNASQLRAVLAGLESKKQAVVLGHAISMPVVIETRTYDEKFYQTVMPAALSGSDQNIMSTIYPTLPTLQEKL